MRMSSRDCSGRWNFTSLPGGEGAMWGGSGWGGVAEAAGGSMKVGGWKGAAMGLSVGVGSLLLGLCLCFLCLWGEESLLPYNKKI